MRAQANTEQLWRDGPGSPGRLSPLTPLGTSSEGAHGKGPLRQWILRASGSLHSSALFSNVSVPCSPRALPFLPSRGPCEAGGTRSSNNERLEADYFFLNEINSGFFSFFIPSCFLFLSLTHTQKPKPTNPEINSALNPSRLQKGCTFPFNCIYFFGFPSQPFQMSMKARGREGRLTERQSNR